MTITFKKYWARFSDNPSLFMAKYGANVAGPIWIAGSTLQLLIGAVALSPRQIIGALFNVVSPATHAFYGHTNKGVMLACILGIIGTVMAVYPGIVNGEIGTIFGITAFVGSSLLGAFSHPLAKKFANAHNKFLRMTLGHPRRTMGLCSFTLCRCVVIFSGFMHDRGFNYIAPFVIWSIGDLVFSLSRPKLEDL
jgi:hypothetical protein